ncbi:hypothetical protein [Geomicrobium sp. JCM 19055]|uniref:hypothetical protein n=1 Tax=Geomicrobium sp. JCM 19055 TaxID=1460649 RepID=UPI00045ED12A|nr:hypothetical protein [Geomicrobium sp. JCM 19055]GAK01606.1 hypothetical protein JCM19055_4786 [Geomicrobium sp. JCM 19055]
MGSQMNQKQYKYQRRIVGGEEYDFLNHLFESPQDPKAVYSKRRPSQIYTSKLHKDQKS